MVTSKMTIRQIKIVHSPTFTETQRAAHCPCPPTPMLMRAERSQPVYAWAGRHLDRYHPREAQ